ncbi:MAG: hypothetical protein FWC12_11815 [Treponema sp.]|nr:hypothetical protein [Treponema sp.]
MSQIKLETITARLLANMKNVKYGNVSVNLKIHDSRVVEVTYLSSEQTKEPKENLNIKT